MSGLRPGGGIGRRSLIRRIVTLVIVLTSTVVVSETVSIVLSRPCVVVVVVALPLGLVRRRLPMTKPSLMPVPSVPLLLASLDTLTSCYFSSSPLYSIAMGINSPTIGIVIYRWTINFVVNSVVGMKVRADSRFQEQEVGHVHVLLHRSRLVCNSVRLSANRNAIASQLLISKIDVWDSHKVTPDAHLSPTKTPNKTDKAR